MSALPCSIFPSDGRVSESVTLTGARLWARCPDTALKSSRPATLLRWPEAEELGHRRTYGLPLQHLRSSRPATQPQHRKRNSLARLGKNSRPAAQPNMSRPDDYVTFRKSFRTTVLPNMSWRDDHEAIRNTARAHDHKPGSKHRSGRARAPPHCPFWDGPPVASSTSGSSAAGERAGPGAAGEGRCQLVPRAGFVGGALEAAAQHGREAFRRQPPPKRRHSGHRLSTTPVELRRHRLREQHKMSSPAQGPFLHKRMPTTYSSITGYRDQDPAQNLRMTVKAMSRPCQHRGNGIGGRLGNAAARGWVETEARQKVGPRQWCRKLVMVAA